MLSETDLIFGVELVYLEPIELPAEYMSWWGSGPRHLKILMVWRDFIESLTGDQLLR